MRRAALLGLLLLAGLAAPLRADLTEALALVEQGDAAAKHERHAEAATAYAAALESEPGCVPARYGLGASLLAGGETDSGIVALREVVRATGDDAPIPEAWRGFRKQAMKLLDEHDKHGRALDRLVDAHVNAVMKIAIKYITKDPDLADRALQIVLNLRPDHKRANELRRKLSSLGLRREAIFDGKQIADWDGGRGQWWNVADGIIIGETKGVATYIRNQTEIEGDYDVVLEARIAKAYDNAPFLALMAAWVTESNHSRFGTLSGAVTWHEHKAEDDKERVFRCEAKRLARPFDPSAWTVYELRYRSNTIHAYVNGREVHSIPRSKVRTGGYVGVLAQGCRAEIRRLDILYR